MCSAHQDEDGFSKEPQYQNIKNAHVNAINNACHAIASARFLSPAPMARATADVVPPPIAPPAIICMSVRKGNTNARLARACVPSLPTYQASANVTPVITATARTLGVVTSTKPSIQAPPESAGRARRGPLPQVRRTVCFRYSSQVQHTGDHDRLKPRVRGVLQSFKGSLSITTERVVARRKHRYRWGHRMERRAGW